MKTRYFDLIYCLEGVRAGVRFNTEQDIQDYMYNQVKPGEDSRFELRSDLTYARVYHNIRPGYKEEATLLFVVSNGQIIQQLSPDQAERLQ
ncbi:hypothetical protein [Spirosoma endbachense]|uniref:Uncharacterized protein n=1 Tax=Spirosoma endbachense TaxID=2666025 RepID=A0A6P1W6D6_9BACT|nr:hypothetical protein [Spirosoma endbachense]QHV99286.1 hypothetical protein GJR95_31620 [Spirosoma endbachense]